MTPQDKNTPLTNKLRKLTDIRVLGLLAFGVIAILITWSGLNVAKTNYELEKKISELEQENVVQDLQNENMRLKNQYYESDEYLELAARAKFNKAAPGERLYLVPEDVELEQTIKSKHQTSSVDEDTNATQG